MCSYNNFLQVCSSALASSYHPEQKEAAELKLQLKNEKLKAQVATQQLNTEKAKTEELKSKFYSFGWFITLEYYEQVEADLQSRVDAKDEEISQQKDKESELTSEIELLKGTLRDANYLTDLGHLNHTKTSFQKQITELNGQLSRVVADSGLMKSQLDTKNAESARLDSLMAGANSTIVCIWASLLLTSFRRAFVRR